MYRRRPGRNFAGVVRGLVEAVAAATRSTHYSGKFVSAGTLGQYGNYLTLFSANHVLKLITSDVV